MVGEPGRMICLGPSVVVAEVAGGDSGSSSGGAAQQRRERVLGALRALEERVGDAQRRREEEVRAAREAAGLPAEEEGEAGDQVSLLFCTVWRFWQCGLAVLPCTGVVLTMPLHWDLTHPAHTWPLGWP